ncbi:MoaD/ThiS family protein [Halorubrum luteum]
MHVTVDVVGGDEHDCVVDDDATYADLIRAVGFHPQEASILVDGSPVPGDGAVDAERVALLRLIKGGSA